MEPYNHSAMSNMHALDFTSNHKPKHNADLHEPPILDLSCKKQIIPSSEDLTRGSIPLELRSTSPSSVDTLQQSSFSDTERKSPFEGRSFMVTPPSESDSPKKLKFEPMYNCINPTSTTIVPQSPAFSNLPVGIPVPMVSTVLPTLLTQNPSAAKQLQIIGAPATSTTSSSSSTSTSYPRETTMPVIPPDTSKKAPRPFKAYPKDPLALTMGPAELIYDPNSNDAYSEFRKRMLESVRKSNEGTNIKMRRVTKSPGLPTSTVDEKDAAYWERRRKNNEAAKRSRDARRAKEDEIAIRAAFLEQENIKLKYELVALRNETAKLRCMVYST